MVSVTMTDTPLYNPSSGLLNFELGPGNPSLRVQVTAYYEMNFRARQMETFADFVISKGFGAWSPHLVRNVQGFRVKETWQSCGRRLFGERFAVVLERKIAEYRASHGAPSATPTPEPPAHISEEIPEPDF
jgi:hypothetical protein